MDKICKKVIPKCITDYLLIQDNIMQRKWSGRMKRRAVYRNCLIVAFVISFATLICMFYYYVDRQVPNSINLFVNDQEEFDFALPIRAELDEGVTVLNVNQKNKVDSDKINFDFNEPFTLNSSELGEYKVDLKLFGIFNYKTITVNVIKEKSVIPSGAPIGVYIESDGVMVLGTSTIVGEDGKEYSPTVNILKSGDYIVAMNGSKVNDKEDFIDRIQKCVTNPVNLLVRRASESVEVSVTPVKSTEGDYKIGTWIRDDTQGIGTLTYVTEDGKFGALGHGITDVDTNQLMEIQAGTLYNAKVLDIVPGEDGTPGEVVGMIQTGAGNDIGTINKNSSQGIFGKINWSNYNLGSNRSYPIGLKQDIHLGNASILCSVEGSVKEYQIQIEKVLMNSSKQNKGLVLKITDEKLLAITNGIVQGMSGSPILQDGKIIGAVTHVFIQDSTKGYGTFVENMLKTGE